MSWLESQRQRLALEEKVVKSQYPHFSVLDRIDSDRTRYEGEHITSAGRTYKICIKIPANFPYEVPNMYITEPHTLYTFNGEKLFDKGTSHAMHTLSSDWKEYIRICHWKSENWSAANSIVAVISKGLIWLEAYEVHLAKGVDIADYLRSQ